MRWLGGEDIAEPNGLSLRFRNHEAEGRENRLLKVKSFVVITHIGSL